MDFPAAFRELGLRKCRGVRCVRRIGTCRAHVCNGAGTSDFIKCRATGIARRLAAAIPRFTCRTFCGSAGNSRRRLFLFLLDCFIGLLPVRDVFTARH